MPAARASVKGAGRQPAAVAPVGQVGLDRQGPEQQGAVPAADAHRREAHGRDQPVSEQGHPAERGEPLRRRLAHPVGRAREPAGPHGTRVQGGDGGLVFRAGRTDDGREGHAGEDAEAGG